MSTTGHRAPPATGHPPCSFPATLGEAGKRLLRGQDPPSDSTRRGRRHPVSFKALIIGALVWPLALPAQQPSSLDNARAAEASLAQVHPAERLYYTDGVYREGVVSESKEMSEENGYALPEVVRPPAPPALDFAGALLDASVEWSSRLPAVALAPAQDLTPKSRGKTVEAWSRALHEHGYGALALSGEDGSVFWPSEVDDQVASAIIAAQDDYGLEADGMAGSYLRANLNADPVQTASEFDAWRQTVEKSALDAWDRGYRRILFVNIPSFTLHAIDLWTGETVLEGRVIVGMPTRRTPRFNTQIVGLKYNPDWSPPPSLRARGRHYMPPGPSNPLGLLRFSTDNTSHIYLHDTNEPELFEHTNRARSSGCIRVQDWKALAAFVSGLQEGDIEDKIATRRTYSEAIDSALVIITYSLVDVVDGHARRHVDVYGLGAMKPVQATSVAR